MINKQTDPNAKQALNMLKMETAYELGFNYNPITDKIESNTPQDTLEGVAENVLAGEQVGGKMTKSLVALGEQMLLNEYNSNK